MQSLQTAVNEYYKQLRNGNIQFAYKGIISFISTLKIQLEKKHPEYYTSGLYNGYMDMTYFGFTPLALKEKKLKVAIVFLHEEGRFEVWLSGINRGVQSEYIHKLKTIDIGKYKLSIPNPGVDSIVESVLEANPNFDNPIDLNRKIEERILQFIEDMIKLLP